VPIDTKHFTSGLMLPVASHHISAASSSTWFTGLLAPIAPSTKLLPSIVAEEKYVGAAVVASAASRIVRLYLFRAVA
jgi:hypothetical protein